MNGNKLDKADIGEMLVIAATASKSGIKQISIDSGDAASVLELAYNHDALVERVEELEDSLSRLVNRGTAYINLDELCNDLDSDDIASIESFFNEELIKADKILEKSK